MLKSKICRGSVFGSYSSSATKMIEEVKNDLKAKQISACDVGCLDGKYSFLIAKFGFKVDCYETNQFYIDGGYADYPFVYDDKINFKKIEVYGLKKRLNLKFNINCNNIKIVERNFYKDNQNQYDFVYTYRSLSRKCYSDIPMKTKIQKLKDSVKEKGILYIEYLIETENEKDSNRFLKRGQMQKYFNRKGWKIFYCNEGDFLVEEKPNLVYNNFHQHNVGRIKVMKDKNKKLDFYKIDLFF